MAEAGHPPFVERWQAEVFALVVQLSQQGHFTWEEWTTCLGEQLALVAQPDDLKDRSRHYHHWVAALERLVVSKGLCQEDEIRKRKEALADTSG